MPCTISIVALLMYIVAAYWRWRPAALLAAHPWYACRWRRHQAFRHEGLESTASRSQGKVFNYACSAYTSWGVAGSESNT